MALRGKVYNISPYLRFHPGGAAILLKAAGKDGTALFQKCGGKPGSWHVDRNGAQLAAVGVALGQRQAYGCRRPFRVRACRLLAGCQACLACPGRCQ